MVKRFGEYANLFIEKKVSVSYHQIISYQYYLFVTGLFALRCDNKLTWSL